MKRTKEETTNERGKLITDGRIILKLILKEGKGVDWINRNQDRDNWPILVNAVVNFWVLLTGGIL
jgi:hypothetical protein